MPPTAAAQAFAYDVFISYSSHDKTWVRKTLLARLEVAGLKIIIDFRDFRIGAPSVTEMERAVMTSRKTLLVLTPAYLASAWGEFEHLMVQTLDPANRALRLLPLLKERCDLPTRIGFLTYVDFTDPDELDLAWQKLLASLNVAPSATAATMSPMLAPATSTESPAPEAIRQLRSALAHLYPDRASARRIAEDAGLSLVYLTFSDRALDNWHEILQEAQKRDCLTALLQVVTEEYGANHAFKAALQKLQA